MSVPVDLSILVLSTHTRSTTFAPRIQSQLYAQYDALKQRDRARVEIMMLTDTKALSIGAKRQVLAQACRGRYVQFVDDDDQVERDMVSSVLRATQGDADVITFLVSVTLDGGPPKTCRYSKDYGRDHNTDDLYCRIPNHICAVKRELALATGWNDINYGEDADFSQRLLPRLQTELAIDRVLYHYEYSKATSESRR
jgi:glycosyltransferase involved in cell wall biosynthesis